MCALEMSVMTSHVKANITLHFILPNFGKFTTNLAAILIEVGKTVHLAPNFGTLLG